MKTEEEFEEIVCNMRKAITKLRNNATDDQMYHLAETQLQQLELQIYTVGVTRDMIRTHNELIHISNELIEKVMDVSKSNGEALENIKDALVVLCDEVNGKKEDVETMPSPLI